MWVTHRSLLLRLPCSTWICPVEDRTQRWHDWLGLGGPCGDRCMGKPAAMGTRDPGLVRASPRAWKLTSGQPWWALFLAPDWSGGRCVVEEKLQCWLQPLRISQQWCVASMAVWVSSTSIPGCRFPPSCPLRLSSYSQQQSSPWVCSPIPTSSSQPSCAPAGTVSNVGRTRLWHGPSV